MARRMTMRELRERHRAGLFAVATALTSEAKRRATRHIDNGTRRNSITQSMTSDGVLWGIPIRSAPHAVYLELGFRPHWVPARHIGLWMRRSGYARAHPRARGVFVGGPGSTLDYGGAGAIGTLMRGRRRITASWRTQGQRSQDLPAGTVGSPVLRPTVREDLRRLAPAAFLRGWRRG
jgi:hypothetical protein